ncbi:M20/M25/M40 family metallo-hydrolase [Polaribacter sp. OB-PA-B3]
MKINNLLVIVLSVITLSCNKSEKEKSINKKLLIDGIKYLSSDDLEGRGFSKPGNYKAQKYIATKFKEIGLETEESTNYIHKFPYTFSGKRRQRMYPIENIDSNVSKIKDTTVFGGNVIGKITGSIDKTIVITGHLDHLGIKNGKIYNGADDDASGTAALIAIADYFKNTKPKHTLIFAAVDAEEIGSLGADYWLKNYKKKNKIVLNINMDMIAHNDSLQLYAAGIHHYPKLLKSLENIESPINLLFGHDNADDKNLDNWTYSSDHRVFHKEKIPFIYFGVEDHKDYHKDTDTFENINQDFYIEAVKLIIKSIENFDSNLTYE